MGELGCGFRLSRWVDLAVVHTSDLCNLTPHNGPLLHLDTLLARESVYALDSAGIRIVLPRFLPPYVPPHVPLCPSACPPGGPILPAQRTASLPETCEPCLQPCQAEGASGSKSRRVPPYRCSHERVRSSRPPAHPCQPLELPPPHARLFAGPPRPTLACIQPIGLPVRLPCSTSGPALLVGVCHPREAKVYATRLRFGAGPSAETKWLNTREDCARATRKTTPCQLGALCVHARVLGTATLVRLCGVVAAVLSAPLVASGEDMLPPPPAVTRLEGKASILQAAAGTERAEPSMAGSRLRVRRIPSPSLCLCLQVSPSRGLCASGSVPLRLCASVHLCICASVHLCICASVCICVCLYVCMSVA